MGSRSKKSVDQLLTANRGVLDKPESLKAGMVLSIPLGETSLPARAALKAASGTAAEPVAASKKAGHGAGGYRWYQVKPNDRYASIARSELGDAGRWRELFELNKDRFPDPHQIREGVRIRVPGAGGKSAEVQR